MIDYNHPEFVNNVLRPAWIEVDLDAIAENARRIREYLGPVQYLAVVKADAYGLGAAPVAAELVRQGIDRLGVVMPDEAIELRRAGITAPILNMGAFLPSHARLVVENNIEQMVYKPGDALALSRAAVELDRDQPVHFKIDTGMSRYGVHYRDALEELLKIASLPRLKIIGAMTHFPKSDALDKSFALLQIELIREFQRQVTMRGIDIPIWHMANSGGALDLPDAHFNMVRVGLMNYGYFPSSDVRRPFPLRPAMSLKTRIVNTRVIGRGDTVGYGRRYMAEKEERIAVLPVGYSDGYDRKLSRIGQVLINGRRAPIIGGLCMDACFINITEMTDVGDNDLVTLMGRDGDEEISPHDIAALTGTVSYEVISRFGRRLPRVYIRNGQIESVKNPLLGAC